MATKFTKSSGFAGLEDYMEDLSSVTAKEAQSSKFPMLRPSFGRRTKKAKKTASASASASTISNMVKTEWSATVKKTADLPTPKIKSRSPTNSSPTSSDQTKDYHQVQVFSEKKAKQIAEFNKRMDERVTEMEDEMFECLDDREIETWMKEKQETEELNEYYDNIDDYEDAHDDVGYDSY